MKNLYRTIKDKLHRAFFWTEYEDERENTRRAREIGRTIGKRLRPDDAVDITAGPHAGYPETAILSAVEPNNARKAGTTFSFGILKGWGESTVWQQQDGMVRHVGVLPDGSITFYGVLPSTSGVFYLTSSQLRQRTNGLQFKQN